MGIRFGKRLRIAPGVNLNLSLRRGLSASLGPKGLTHNVGLDGKRRTTVSAPGTGLSVVHEHRATSATPGAQRHRALAFAIAAAAIAAAMTIGVFLL